MTADNQQERLEDGFNYYISGFVDGEGTFHIAIQKTNNVRVGYQLIPEFRISQRMDRSIIPFFRRYPLYSQKNLDFIKFSKIVESMVKKEHLERHGLLRLMKIAYSMNRNGKYRTIHKHTLNLLESSETIRQTCASRA